MPSFIASRGSDLMSRRAASSPKLSKRPNVIVNIPDLCHGEVSCPLCRECVVFLPYGRAADVVSGLPNFRLPQKDISLCRKCNLLLSEIQNNFHICHITNVKNALKSGKFSQLKYNDRAFSAIFAY